MKDDHIGSNEEILRWDWGKHGRGGVEEGQERKNASMRVLVLGRKHGHRRESMADHFNCVGPCGKLGEGEEIDIWPVSEALVDDSLCTEGKVRWEEV